jgi:hypothetical protein
MIAAVVVVVAMFRHLSLVSALVQVHVVVRVLGL